MSAPYLSTGIFLGNPALDAAWQLHLQPHPGGNLAALQPDPRANLSFLQPHPGGNLSPLQPRPGGLRYGSIQEPDDFGAMAEANVQTQRSSYAVHPSTASPWPWRGIHSAWTFGSQASLQSQALRKVRSRLIGERDVRRDKSRAGPPDQEAPALWRWGSEFRQQAVVAELLSHTVVHQRAVYAAVHDFSDANAPSCSLHKLLDVAPLGTANVPFDYSQQIDKVLRAAVEREERLPEILTQAADFRAFFYSLCGLDAVPTPHVDELILVAWAWASHVAMALKNNVAELRPVQRSSVVMPVIATPAHGSLPSGHATVAALTAHLLTALLYQAGDARADVLHRLASRIAFNRVVAGVHFPMDSFVGWHLGAQLATLFDGMARAKTKLPEPVELTVIADSEWAEETLLPPRVNTSKVKAPVVEPLQAMWAAAEQELRDLRFKS